MSTAPQPMNIRRQGAKRGDHGPYIDPETPTDYIGTDTTRAARTPRGAGDSTARAKAAYDARPKVIFRGVEPDTDAKLRAIYRHQLHRPGGIEGWSEWGRTLLDDFIDRYEREHGDVGEDTEPLRAGRRTGT